MDLWRKSKTNKCKINNFLEIFNFTKTKIFKISSSSLTGNNPSISAQTTIDGGIEYYPIQGDMLRTAHTIPQVEYKMI